MEFIWARCYKVKEPDARPAQAGGVGQPQSHTDDDFIHAVTLI